MWHRLLLHLASCLAVLSVGTLAAKSHGRGTSASGARVVELTDLNFDEAISNGKPWVVNVYAHHCQLTHELEDLFDKVVRQLHPDISVGRIDGSNERGLMSRFQLRGYHGVYHLNGTETREYCSGHGCEGQQLSPKQLVKFARDGWKGVAPRTGCGSPISKCGRAMGQITKLPARMKTTYNYLHDERHYSDLTLFAGMLAVPVAIGLSFICMLDVYYSRRPLAMTPHVHYD